MAEDNAYLTSSTDADFRTIQIASDRGDNDNLDDLTDMHDPISASNAENNRLISNPSLAMSEASYSPPVVKKERLLCLDIFRGATVALMVFVDNNGDDEYTFSILKHAKWNGFTFADIVFPSFLFIVGVAIVMAMSSQTEETDWKKKMWTYLKICRRTVLLIAIGLIYNAALALPNIWYTRVCGVLQRIAICYFINAILFVSFPVWLNGLFMVVFGTIYLGAMCAWDVPDGCGRFNITPECCAEGYIDRFIIGSRRMYHTEWDPEGILSTCNAVISTYVGILAGVSVKKIQSSYIRSVLWFYAGCCFLTLGLLLHVYFMPLNKNIYSPSYLWFTCGISFFALLYSYIQVDIWQQRWMLAPLKWVGMNPLAVYVGSMIFEVLTSNFAIKGQTPWLWAYWYVFVPISPSADIASLYVAIANVLGWMAVAGILYRAGIFIKL